MIFNSTIDSCTPVICHHPLTFLIVRVLTSFGLLPGWEDARHHLFLGDEMVNTLQEAQQILHIAAPLVQHIICIAGLGEVDQPSRSVNLRIDGLRGNQVTDVLLGFLLGQVQKLGQAPHLDAGVILRHDTHIVFNDALAKVLPPFVWLIFSGLTRLGLKDVGIA